MTQKSNQPGSEPSLGALSNGSQSQVPETLHWAMRSFNP